MENQKLLSLTNINKSFFTANSQIEVLKDISFCINSNQIVALLGPSGCGKSTILNILSNLEKPTSGELIINCKLGYMFQKDALLPWRNIYSNICLGLEISKTRTQENLNYALSLIDKYKLKEFINSFPSQISGGMKQRVALIRTLVLKPDLLLLDEPFSALDYQTRLSVCNDVYEIIKAEGKTTVLVTHDISEAISVADKILVLTNRPATILNEYIIDFNKQLSPLKRREEKGFAKLFEKIWEDLHK